MSGARLDSAAVIDGAPVSGVQKRTITLCLAVALLDGLDAQLIAFAAPLIIKEYGLGPAEFGVVFSAGLLGMTVGSFLFGSVADRIGRRKVVLFCTLLFGVLTLALPLASSITTVVVLRFIAGLGLGGATPSLVALVAEYTPARVRSMAVMLMVGMLSLGGFVGGIVAAVLIPRAGWGSLFIVGGALPILVLVGLWFGLPESVRFLFQQGRVDDARHVLARIVPYADDITGSTVGIVSAEPSASPIATLFARRRALSTLILWIVFLANMLVLFSLLSWLPILFGGAGISSTIAFTATGIFSLGGFLGGIGLGYVIDRTGSPHRVLIVGYLAAVAGILATAWATSVIPVLLLAVFVVGVGIAGGQTGITALAASMYPTEARGTGVGWALGVGRIGSIIGPSVGGIMLAAGLGATSIVALAVVPVAVAVAGVASLAFRLRDADVLLADPALGANGSR